MAEPGEAHAPGALSHVFTPVEIGGLKLPHRIVMGSMHLGLEGLDDAGERLAAFYRERALGGAGLIVTGGWAVSADGAADGSYGILDPEPPIRGRPYAPPLGGGRPDVRLPGLRSTARGTRTCGRPNPPIAPVRSTATGPIPTLPSSRAARAS